MTFIFKNIKIKSNQYSKLLIQVCCVIVYPLDMIIYYMLEEERAGRKDA